VKVQPIRQSSLKSVVSIWSLLGPSFVAADWTFALFFFEKCTFKSTFKTFLPSVLSLRSCIRFCGLLTVMM
jgi:hypothetical protein